MKNYFINHLFSTLRCNDAKIIYVLIIVNVNISYFIRGPIFISEIKIMPE